MPRTLAVLVVVVLTSPLLADEQVTYVARNLPVMEILSVVSQQANRPIEVGLGDKKKLTEQRISVNFEGDDFWKAVHEVSTAAGTGFRLEFRPELTGGCVVFRSRYSTFDYLAATSSHFVGTQKLPDRETAIVVTMGGYSDAIRILGEPMFFLGSATEADMQRRLSTEKMSADFFVTECLLELPRTTDQDFVHCLVLLEETSQRSTVRLSSAAPVARFGKSQVTLASIDGQAITYSVRWEQDAAGKARRNERIRKFKEAGMLTAKEREDLADSRKEYTNYRVVSVAAQDARNEMPLKSSHTNNTESKIEGKVTAKSDVPTKTELVLSLVECRLKESSFVIPLKRVR